MGFRHRVLSVFIVLALLCTVTCTNIIAEDDFTILSSPEVTEEKVSVPENVSGLLQALGLLSISEIEATGYVSRGFATEILLRLENMSARGTASGTMYSDVTTDNSYAYTIETSSTYGYFFGTGDGKFGPNDNITPVHMATVLLRLAGYPNNAISASSELGKLVRHASGSDKLTYSELANMLYEFLNINIVKVTGGSPSNPDFVKSGTETILDDCFDIYEYEGVVTENSITGLRSNSDLRKNRVVISGKKENVVFNTGDTDIDLMIGRYVKMYYRKVKNDLSVCVYYYVPDSTNDITEIDFSDINYNRTTDSQLVYTKDNTRRTIKYDKQTALLYNGTFYCDNEAIFDKIKEKDGKITVIDNNNDGTADVFNIEAYESFVVNSVVLSSGIVFEKTTNQSLSLNEEDYDKFSLTDVNGNVVVIEDLVEGMVLTVAKNSDNATRKVIKAIVTNQAISGTVTRIYQDDMDNDIIELDNMNSYMVLKNVTKPNIGQGVSVMLNSLGKIAWIDYSNAGEFVFGMVTRVKKKDRTDSVLIKMITAKNTIEEFNVQDKLVVDKATYKDMDKLYAKLYSEESISVGGYKFPAGIYPVRYKLKPDGSLAELDTCNIGASENKNTLQMYFSGTHMLQSELIMGGSYALKESTPVFKITATADGSKIVGEDWFEDTRYTEMTNVKSAMTTGSSYNYAAYKVDTDSWFADFVIVYSAWDSAYTDKLFVVEKISTVYDEATESVLRSLHGVEGGVEKDMIVSDLYTETFDGIGLSCGDVIRYRTDGYNHIVKIESDGSVIKHNADSISINNISAGQTSTDRFREYASSTQMIFGYVLERRDNYITISVIPPLSTIDGKRSRADMEKDSILIKIPDTTPITVYDPTETDRVFAATYDEILGYKTSGKHCSLVALHFRTARLLDAVVLNDYSLYEQN